MANIMVCGTVWLGSTLDMSNKYLSMWGRN